MPPVESLTGVEWPRQLEPSRAPGMRFSRHHGIYQSDVAEEQPNPGAEANRLPLVGPGSQVQERAGRNTLSLIVPMSSDRLFLDRVGRHQSPSPLHRHEQINTHSQVPMQKGDISTLQSWGTFP
jgi:hypothetical protein